MSWLDRILGREELPEAERREVDARLQGDAAARAFYERVVAAESAPGPRGELPPLDTLELDATDRFAAEASRRELLRRAQPAATAASRPDVRRPGRGLVYGPLALAAALALLFWFSSRPDPIASFELERRAETRGAEAVPQWREGDAIQLRAELTAEGHAAVLHLGADGLVTWLQPPTRVLPGDGPLVLPPPESDERWTLTGETGREVFWLVVWSPSAATSPRRPSAAELTAEATRIAAGARNATEAEALLARWLRDIADAVQTREIRR